LVPFAKPAAKVVKEVAANSGKAAGVAGVGAMVASEDAEAVPFFNMRRVIDAIKGAKSGNKASAAITLSSEEFSLTKRQAATARAIYPEWDGRVTFSSDHIVNSRSQHSEKELESLLAKSGDTKMQVVEGDYPGFVVLRGIPNGATKPYELVLRPDPKSRGALQIFSAVTKGSKRD